MNLNSLVEYHMMYPYQVHLPLSPPLLLSPLSPLVLLLVFLLFVREKDSQKLLPRVRKALFFPLGVLDLNLERPLALNCSVLIQS